MWMLVACISTAVFADEPVAEAEISAAQIAEKNVAARGGLEPWRKIQSMVWIGYIERAGAASLPYVLEQKRPNKTHFEIMAKNQVATRIYDGTHGWKLHPASNGTPTLQPYTDEELNFARDGQGIDGELVDYQAKGIALTLDGVDEVEGRKAYRLSVQLPSGASHHLWIDAQTFLDVKYDRPSRNALGHSSTVTVFYRNYQTIDGLQIPRLIESGVDTAKAMDKMVIDKISLNPPLEDRMFAKPNVPEGRNAVKVDITHPQAVRQAVHSASVTPTGFSRLNPRSVHGSAVAR